MVFARNLDDGRERRLVLLDLVPYPVRNLGAEVSVCSKHMSGAEMGTYPPSRPSSSVERTWAMESRGTNMLVDEDDANVVSRLREVLKCILDLFRLGLRVDDKEVPLLRWACSYVLYFLLHQYQEYTSSGIERIMGRFRKGGGGTITPIPASRRPVTES